LEGCCTNGVKQCIYHIVVLNRASKQWLSGLNATYSINLFLAFALILSSAR
jgi:hypothetical protein